ncbi:glycosyltransferase family 4 protein [Vibrio parahaemolyticus]|uniref:glycosyltransferase family 4 protein n=1 Tax=Vibrio TaxID=662 RepID=UPI001A2A97DE|nr:MULTISPECIES: glycosyltransferase family 4 protein [Vibrio]EGQ8605201.1 glycosyltransferase [Vibrio parahaemolyticus]EHZ2782099.1 glycosyltransferase family 4 protein [Vibrio parahaemolyticus]EKG2653958.1 glycosyltransferase family 4 protein [Vibrio parahaemolyticus]MCR9485517.1 glycosyltransferase family 4 protein [Vibrio alginolyticus]MDW2123465.1 glycosyltransferase family 4 protein [Vibrio sp. 2033]
MNIYIISHELPPIGGGAGTIAKTLYSEMFSISDDKKNVYLMTNNKAEIENDIITNVIKVKASKFKPIKYLYKVFLNRKNADFFILNDLRAHLAMAFFPFKKYQSKAILIIHGSEPEMIISSKIIFVRQALVYLYKRLIANSKNVVFVSDYVKNRFLNKLEIMPESKFIVINNGVPSLELNSKTNRSSNVISILSASRIVEGKGYVKMYKYLSELRKDLAIQWHIAGDGPFLKKFKDITINDEWITFHGRLNSGSLQNLMAASDCFILLSELTEAHPLSYMEAAMVGCPSIGYSRYGTLDSIISGKTGYFVDYESSHEGLLSSLKKSLLLDRNEIANVARSEFNMKNMIDKYLKLVD